LILWESGKQKNERKAKKEARGVKTYIGRKGAREGKMQMANNKKKIKG